MVADILKHLYDIRDAALAICRFVEGKTFTDYEKDDLLQSGVERKFEIIGEALNRIKKDYPIVLESIRDYRSVISFRNILIHGYDAINTKIVWGIIEEDLGKLIEDVDKLIKDKDRTN
jgi:uncharacterized protein with HEPN domain